MYCYEARRNADEGKTMLSIHEEPVRLLRHYCQKRCACHDHSKHRVRLGEHPSRVIPRGRREGVRVFVCEKIYQLQQKQMLGFNSLRLLIESQEKYCGKTTMLPRRQVFGSQHAEYRPQSVQLGSLLKSAHRKGGKRFARWTEASCSAVAHDCH